MQQAPILTDALLAALDVSSLPAGAVPELSTAFGDLFAQFLQLQTVQSLPTIPGKDADPLPIGDGMLAEVAFATQQLIADGILFEDSLPTGDGDDQSVLKPIGDGALSDLAIGMTLPQMTLTAFESRSMSVSGDEATPPRPDVLPQRFLTRSQPDATLNFDGPALSVLGRVPENGRNQERNFFNQPVVAAQSARPVPNVNAIPLSILPEETRTFEPVKLDANVARTEPAVATNGPATNLDIDPELNAPAADRNAHVLARADRQEFVNRLTEAMHQAYRSSPKRLSFDLTPPELGRVHIEIRQVDGQLAARIEAADPTARHLLVEHLPTLERQLQQSGVQIQRFEVQQSSESMHQNGDQSGRQRSGQEQERHERSSQSYRQNEPSGLSKGDDATLSMSDLLNLATGMNRVI